MLLSMTKVDNLASLQVLRFNQFSSNIDCLTLKLLLTILLVFRFTSVMRYKGLSSLLFPVYKLSQENTQPENARISVYLYIIAFQKVVVGQ